LPSEADVKLGVEFGPGESLTGTYDPEPEDPGTAGDLEAVLESLSAIQAKTDQLIISDGKVAASADVDIDFSAVSDSLAAIQAQTDQLAFDGSKVLASTDIDAEALAELIAGQIPGADSQSIAADVVAAMQAGTYGVGATLRTFVSKVSGVPTPGVTVAVYRDASLTQQHGGTQVSDGLGRTFWFVAPGATYYVRQQRDGYTFPVEVEVG